MGYAGKHQKLDLRDVVKNVAIARVETFFLGDEIDEPIRVGVVWDDSGFTPLGAMFVADEATSPYEVIEASFEVLTSYYLENCMEYIQEAIDEGYDFDEGWSGEYWELTLNEAMSIKELRDAINSYLE